MMSMVPTGELERGPERGARCGGQPRQQRRRHVSSVPEEPDPRVSAGAGTEHAHHAAGAEPGRAALPAAPTAPPAAAPAAAPSSTPPAQAQLGAVGYTHREQSVSSSCFTGVGASVECGL